jgi:hypothetical protein
MRPCKHLDYDGNYPTCALVTLPEGVRYWRRPLFYEGQKQDVQFCKLRGRINSILDCYEPPGPLSCYEPAPDTAKEPSPP